ncbi:MAG: SIS domain-containing protein [Promethearchaeota archaeon]
MNSPAADFMREEINEQPKILSQILATFPDFAVKHLKPDFEEVWLTGSGDSHCAAIFGASLLNQLGIPARAFPPMELSNFHGFNTVKNPCLIAISVSGKTPRILEVVKKIKHNFPDAIIIGLTDNPNSPLYQESSLPILIGASPAEALLTSDYTGKEAKEYTGYHHDVAQTKTYFANLVWLLVIAWIWSDSPKNVIETLEALGSQLEKWIKKAEDWAKNHPLSFPMKTIFLGSGLMLSLAQYGQYKWFEFTFPGLKHDLEEYAHTQYFTTDTQTSIVFFGPLGSHQDRIKELVHGALKDLIKPEIFLFIEENSHQSLVKELSTVLLTPSISEELLPIWHESIFYFYALIGVMWMTYYTAQRAGLDTNRFRGGQGTEKYIRGSYHTIRKSKIVNDD